MTTRNDIERVLWKACDSFRGKIDSSRYKDYILSMLFVKYLSDVTLERRALYMEQYDGDERRVERAMSRERFSLDRESTFDYLYENRTDTEIGQKINVALSHIEDHNSGKLRIVFRAIEAPIKQIAENAGLSGDVVIDKVRSLPDGQGLNAATNEYEDLLAAGVTDPVKVTRSALQNAASIAGLFLTTEAVVANKPEPPAAAPAAGADMGY